MPRENKSNRRQEVPDEPRLKRAPCVILLSRIDAFLRNTVQSTANEANRSRLLRQDAHSFRANAAQY